MERPLSLQTHPDAEQARAGRAREAAAAPGAARLYADAHGKPELVCALTPFTALCGLRSPAELRQRLARFGLARLAPAAGAPTDLLALLRHWLGGEAAVLREILDRALAGAEAAAAVDPDAAAILDLAAEHPGDPGVLAPLFLHRIELAPGEALFLPPGELHCYLRGVAVELMASSDNVLRAGLTRKAVDVAELLRVVRPASRRPPILQAEPRENGEGVWRTPAPEFELSLLTPGPDAPVVVSRRAGVEILWCAEGALHVEPAGGTGVALARGESCLVPAAAGPYRVAGTGRAFRAALPSATPG